LPFNAPQLAAGFFTPYGDFGFDEVDAALGEPMLDFAHQALADAALSMGPFAL